MTLIRRLRPYLNAWGWDHQDEVLDAIGPVATLPDFTPFMALLQAQKDELTHLVTMDALAFQLIAEHPDQAQHIAAEALARIQRSAA